MPYVDIDARDGTFKVVSMSEARADSLAMQGGDPIYVEDAVYEAWLAHERERAAFNALWIQLQNERAQKQQIAELRHQISMLERYGKKS